MTEEIIIDGVNVAECEFYELCGCIDDNHELNQCKDNPNCYYKQLQRLKQENEKLSFQLKLAQADYEASEQENDIHHITRQKLLEDLDRAETSMMAWKDESIKYRKALEEIREMFLNRVAWVGQLTNFEEEIYNKINEVLGNDI